MYIGQEYLNFYLDKKVKIRELNVIAKITAIKYNYVLNHIVYNCITIGPYISYETTQVNNNVELCVIIDLEDNYEKFGLKYCMDAHKATVKEKIIDKWHTKLMHIRCTPYWDNENDKYRESANAVLAKLNKPIELLDQVANFFKPQVKALAEFLEVDEDDVEAFF